MKIKLLSKAERGRLLQKAKGLDGKSTFDVGNAVLLTGANGAGKTVLIDALAASAGLSGRYSSSKTSYAYSSLDSRSATEDHGGASLVEGRSKIKFDLVLRYRGEETRKGPIALDTLEDIMSIMTSEGSHGQVSLHRLGTLLVEAREYLEKKKGSLLVLLDEPETAIGPDYLLRMVDRLHILCEQAMRMDRFKIVIATQNPFLVFGIESGGATRLDLGGWYEDIDPFPRLIEHAESAYRAAAETQKP